MGAALACLGDTWFQEREILGPGQAGPVNSGSDMQPEALVGGCELGPSMSRPNHLPCLRGLGSLPWAVPAPFFSRPILPLPRATQEGNWVRPCCGSQGPQVMHDGWDEQPAQAEVKAGKSRWLWVPELRLEEG